MRWLGEFLLLSGKDATLSQGYPQHDVCWYPFIHLDGEKHCESKRKNTTQEHKKTTQCPQPELESGPFDPEMSSLTMKPPCIPQLPCLDSWTDCRDPFTCTLYTLSLWEALSQIPAAQHKHNKMTQAAIKPESSNLESTMLPITPLHTTCIPRHLHIRGSYKKVNLPRCPQLHQSTD